MGRKISFLLSYWWCMLLLVLGLIPLFFGNPEGGVSESENRTLQAAPQFSLASWFDGTFSGELETYLSDQMIGRDGILSASRGILGVFDVTSEKDRIVHADIDEELDRMANADTDDFADESDAGMVLNVTIVTEATAAPAVAPTAPPQANPEATPEPTAAPVATAEPVDPTVKDLSIVRKFGLIRTDGSFTTRFNFAEDAMTRTIASLNTYRAALPEDGTVIFTYIPYSYDANEWLLDTEHFSGWSSNVEPTIQANVEPGVYVFSAVEELEPYMAAGEQVYYKVDHHWSGLGAFYMQRLMMTTWGIPSIAYEDFDYTVHENFRGSLSSKVSSDLYDRLEVPDALAPTHAYVYRRLNQLVREVRYMEPERVTYSAFLGGTHSPFYVAVTGFHTGHSALVVCDSFGNAFVPYIAPYYDRVCLVDLRDTHDFVTGGGGAPLRDYFKEYGIDDVYFIVSRGTGVNSSYMQSIVRKYL
ncbi:MAG: hypothetical protein IJP98_02460 [Clostridia bacterium]|nr:hypothetical protein [Clostridia bacterium]